MILIRHSGEHGHGPLDPPQAALAAENCQRFEQAEADGLASDCDAQRVDQLADLNSFSGDEVLECFFDRGGVERLDCRKTAFKLCQQRGCFGWLAEALFERGLVIGDLVVGDEKGSVVKDVAGDFDAVPRRRDDCLELVGD